MAELHSNFTAEGSKMVQNGMLPANHAEHETVEITQGFNSWIEVGFYISTSILPTSVVRKSSLLARVAKHVLATVILTFVLILGVIPAFSQMNIAEISGLVKDPSGARVANATVEAVATGTRLKYTATSNASGEFLLAQLPVGVYKLTATAKRFKQSVMSDVTAHAGDKLRATFSLEIGDADQVVTVTGEAGLLQTESAAIKDTIQQAQVIDLPLKGRNFIDLVGLAPGVTTPPAGTRGSALQQTGTVFGILGQRSGHNLYLVDGVAVTDEAYNNMVLSPSVDDVQEVNINETSYDAEFGGKSGGVINVITKFGSNQLHGSAFEFVRNDIFDGKNFFVSPTAAKPPFKQNQFGASLGGPIQKDKTFFFLDYEGERIRQSRPRYSRSPPLWSAQAISPGQVLRSTTQPLEPRLQTIQSPPLIL